MNLRTSAETTLLRTLLGLPERVQRRLGGRPLVLDGQTLAADLQLMLLLQKLARKGELGADDLDRGRAAMRTNAGIVGGDQPIGAIRELTVAGLPARHYLPHGARPASSAQGLLVFFHGGGFLYGDLDSHDAPCRVLAETSGVPVLAIDYGLGPEAAFPQGFDDAVAAVRWVVEHADELGADPARIGVAGDSAGGNIAAWAAIASAREGVPLAFQLLVYPCTDPDRQTDSLRLFGEGLYLTAESMEMFNDIYLPTAQARADERVNLLDVDLPSGLAPAYVVTAGFDPLRDEGEAYARRLADAGHEVEMRRYVDQIHGFLNIVGAGRSSRAAVLEIAGRLRAALG
ncbi:alpha/beta hydrolase [Nocardioides sp. Root190]|uniref:alpha/beta hydrolase n=1 Tax=Nocardioides sp. Root190 TaxID=1736488 RepID=UPI000A47668C|nr:alpha/beta hydrolase [Nocardioides sp. Root190]